jgi:uncharacterized protein (DUF2267 family)
VSHAGGDRRGTAVSPEPAERPGIAAEVEDAGVLPVGVRGSEAVSAVLCVLAQRLSGGEARNEAITRAVFRALRQLLPVKERHDVARQLPWDLQEL